MIEATTDPHLRAAAAAAHIERSLVAWRLIAAVSAFALQVFTKHEKGVAPEGDPILSAACAA